MGAASAAAGTAAAASSMSWDTSRPVTRPVGPTSAAASRVVGPVPQPTSSTASPGASPAAANRWADTGASCFSSPADWRTQRAARSPSQVSGVSAAGTARSSRRMRHATRWKLRSTVGCARAAGVLHATGAAAAGPVQLDAVVGVDERIDRSGAQEDPGLVARAVDIEHGVTVRPNWTLDKVQIENSYGYQFAGPPHRARPLTTPGPAGADRGRAARRDPRRAPPAGDGAALDAGARQPTSA